MLLPRSVCLDLFALLLWRHQRQSSHGKQLAERQTQPGKHAKFPNVESLGPQWRTHREDSWLHLQCLDTLVQHRAGESSVLVRQHLTHLEGLVMDLGLVSGLKVGSRIRRHATPAKLRSTTAQKHRANHALR